LCKVNPLTGTRGRLLGAAGPIFAGSDSPWWDDRSTPQIEHRDDILGAAMTAAADELTNQLGSNPSRWRWGQIHTLEVQNESFGTSGIGPIEWLFNVGPVPVSGGSNIVNATGWSEASIRSAATDTLTLAP
jgi:penicillin amidase